jgi:hypothetical protein
MDISERRLRVKNRCCEEKFAGFLFACFLGLSYYGLSGVSFLGDSRVKFAVKDGVEAVWMPF